MGSEWDRATVRFVHRIFTTSFASVYPHYVAKVERKGRTKAELDQVIEWLTGTTRPTLQRHLAADTTFEAFFAEAHAEPERLVHHRRRVRRPGRDVEDPLMQKIRYLDKLVDELAKGKAMEKILRA